MSQESHVVSGIMEFFDLIAEHPEVYKRQTNESALAIYIDIMHGLNLETKPAAFTIGWLVAMHGVEDHTVISCKIPRTEWQFMVAFNAVVNHAPALQSGISYTYIRRVAALECKIAVDVALEVGKRNLTHALHTYIKLNKPKRFMSGEFLRSFNGMYRMINPEHRVNHPAFRNVGTDSYKFSREFIEQYYNHIYNTDSLIEAIALSLETVGKDAITFETVIGQ